MDQDPIEELLAGMDGDTTPNALEIPCHACRSKAACSCGFSAKRVGLKCNGKWLNLPFALFKVAITVPGERGSIKGVLACSLPEKLEEKFFSPFKPSRVFFPSDGKQWKDLLEKGSPAPLNAFPKGGKQKKCQLKGLRKFEKKKIQYAMESLDMLFVELDIGFLPPTNYEKMSKYFFICGEPCVALLCKQMVTSNHQGLDRLVDTAIDGWLSTRNSNDGVTVEMIEEYVVEDIRNGHKHPLPAFVKAKTDAIGKGRFLEAALFAQMSHCCARPLGPKRRACITMLKDNFYASREDWKDPTDLFEGALEEPQNLPNDLRDGNGGWLCDTYMDLQGSDLVDRFAWTRVQYEEEIARLRNVSPRLDVIEAVADLQKVLNGIQDLDQRKALMRQLRGELSKSDISVAPGEATEALEMLKRRRLGDLAYEYEWLDGGEEYPVPGTPVAVVAFNKTVGVCSRVVHSEQKVLFFSVVANVGPRADKRHPTPHTICRPCDITSGKPVVAVVVLGHAPVIGIDGKPGDSIVAILDAESGMVRAHCNEEGAMMGMLVSEHSAFITMTMTTQETKSAVQVQVDTVEMGPSSASSFFGDAVVTDSGPPAAAAPPRLPAGPSVSVTVKSISGGNGSAFSLFGNATVVKKNRK